MGMLFGDLKTTFGANSLNSRFMRSISPPPSSPTEFPSAPMTILQYITPSRLGGAERYFLKLVEELGMRGHHVIVVTKRDTPLRYELERLSATWPESARPELHFWHTRGKIDPWTLWKLVKLIRARGVQIINTHLTTASWQGTLAGRITGIPVAAVVHATDRKTFFQHADHLIAVAGGVAQFLQEQGVPAHKIETLYCGLDLRDVAAVAQLSPQSAKARLDLPPDALTVGIAASLIRRKGHRFLLEALQILEKRGLSVHALLAGEGDQEDELRDLSESLGLENRVHFLGFRRDVHEVIAAMDVFTLPSEKEGLSIAVMEALALARPVVATQIAGMDEVVKHGENGFLVPPCDAPALADALEVLLRDANLRQQMGKRGKAFVENHFEQSQCVARVEAFFQSLVKNTPSQTRPSAVPSETLSETISETLAKRSPSALSSGPLTPPLTILQYITPSRIGGAERYFLRLISHLARQGHRVIVVTKRDTPLRAEVEKLAPLGIEIHSWLTHGKIDPWTLLKLCLLIRRERVDLINTHLTTASWLGSIAARLTGVPSVARVPSTDQARFFKFSHHLIAVSEGVRDHLQAQGVSAEKIAVLYNGIDLTNYQPSLSGAEAKARLGLSPETRTIGVAANLIPRKGHRFLLKALKAIESDAKDVHLLLAGEGSLLAELQEQTRLLGLQDRVHFLGFRSDMVEVETAMDIFVLPSLREGLSNAVMEAMALERPVIATHIAGLPEVVRDGETGLLVPPGDVEALSLALLRLLHDPDFAASLGKRGRLFLERSFDQNRCFDEVEFYFQQVVDARRAKRKPLLLTRSRQGNALR